MEAVSISALFLLNPWFIGAFNHESVLSYDLALAPIAYMFYVRAQYRWWMFWVLLFNFSHPIAGHLAALSWFAVELRASNSTLRRSARIGTAISVALMILPLVGMAIEFSYFRDTSFVVNLLHKWQGSSGEFSPVSVLNNLGLTALREAPKVLMFLLSLGGLLCMSPRFLVVISLNFSYILFRGLRSGSVIPLLGLILAGMMDGYRHEPLYRRLGLPEVSRKWSLRLGMISVAAIYGFDGTQERHHSLTEMVYPWLMPVDDSMVAASALAPQTQGRGACLTAAGFGPILTEYCPNTYPLAALFPTNLQTGKKELRVFPVPIEWLMIREDYLVANASEFVEDPDLHLSRDYVFLQRSLRGFIQQRHGKKVAEDRGISLYHFPPESVR